MSRILYWLVILPISFLPFPLLYLLSDFLYLLIYHVFGYRKKVVYTNLQNSFPEKTNKEIEQIAKKFYSHLCDLIVESIKVFTINSSDLEKRIVVKNPELINSIYAKKRSVIGATAHFGNWEWAGVTINHHSNHQAWAIYHPLKDKYLDKKLRASRTKAGTHFMSTKEVAQIFERTVNDLCLYAFVADQTPSNIKNCHWMTFLNQDTPIFRGSEKYARLYNLPVVFGEIEKVKRGYYEITYILITETPLLTAENEITEKIALLTEAMIKVKPEFWLWSHRRWKHRRPADYKPMA